MATRFLLRTLLSSSVNQTLTPRSFATSSYLLRFRPAVAVATANLRQSIAATTPRTFSTRLTTSSLNDSSPNWSNRPPKETILLDGCDFEHWLVVVDKPEGEPTRDEIIDSYINTLAKVVGSYDEARMKIYSVSTRCYYAFGALVSEELSYKLKELPGVRWVLPDSYLDVNNKDYGGEPFIDGKAVPYDPKYHEEWIKNNARVDLRKRRPERPRNNGRSNSFERRRENMQNNRGPPNMSGPPPPNNMSGPPPNTMSEPPNNWSGPPPPNNMSGPPNNWSGPPPPNNMSGPPNNWSGPPPPNNMSGPPNNWSGPPPPNNMSGPPNNWSGPPPPNNMSGPPNNWNGPPPPNNMSGPPNNWNGPPPPNNMSGPPNNWNGPPPPNMSGPPNNWNGPPPPNNISGPPNNWNGPPPPNMKGGQPNNWNGPPPPYNGGPQNTGGPNYQQQGRHGPNNGGMPYQSGPGPNSYQPNAGQAQDVPGRDMPSAANYE